MFLKSIQYLSLSNVFTSSDIIIVIVWLKHIFISKFFAHSKLKNFTGENCFKGNLV